jgi:phage-related minor tail protein
MGEAGPEAVMPLTRMGNGRLGVQAAGGDAMSLSLTIVDKTQGGIGVEDTQASQNGIKIDLLVQQLDSKLAGLAASGKSRFVGAMEKTHRMPSKRGWN